jgi:hypothetical protein
MRAALSHSDKVKLGLAGALAATTMLASAAVLAALNGGGAARLGPWTALEIAAGYDRAADSAMATMRPEGLEEAQRLSQLAIAQNPYDTSAWLRIASADALIHGRLTKTGVTALSRSYDLVGIDPYVATWRTAFALEHWHELPAEVKADTRSEAMAVGRPWTHRKKMLRALASVRNPKGRMTAALWAARLRASDRP